MLATILFSALRQASTFERLAPRVRYASWPSQARIASGLMLAWSCDGNHFRSASQHRFCSSDSGKSGKGDKGDKSDNKSSGKDESPKIESENSGHLTEEVTTESVTKSSGEAKAEGKAEKGEGKAEGKAEVKADKAEGGKGEGGGGGGRGRRPSLFQRILKASGSDKNKNNNAVETVVESESAAKEGSKDSKDSAAAVVEESATQTSSGAIVPAGPRPENFPKVLALPLTRRPLFPGFYAPIHIKDPKLADSLIELRARGTPYVGAFLLKDAEEKAKDAIDEKTSEKTEETKEPDLKGEALYKRLHEYGTFAQVLNVIRSVDSDGPAQVFLMGHRRLRLTGKVLEDPLTVSVEHLKDKPYDETSDIIKATFMEVVASLRDLMRYNPLYKETIQVFVQNMGNSQINAARLADFGSALTTADEPLLQEVLEQLDVEKRLNLALMLLKKELELAKLQASIAKSVEEKISGDQRRFFLMEQLKALKKELGLEADDKTALTLKFKERLEPNRKNCPEHVIQVIDEELSKLQGLESSSSEFNVTRNYLDWLTSLPWGHYSEENFDVRQAQKILDEDHYGLLDVKERILEFIAVGKLKGSAIGKIICLSGPPGVGKTSIGKSIAKALNRKFYRFSVGGLSDVAEIKGHRRTYVGAMPGKMVQCLKSTGTANPLVLIDEIDKLGRGHAGDPASAMLELLDPEQNANFLDHYLDVAIDLSKVLFVCTANLVENIPAPLLDRMEVIRLVGYITDEKMHIARDYLERAARDSSGIKQEQVEVSDRAMHALIETYCREAGVRNLQKHIEKVYRKIALKLVRRLLEASGKDDEMKERSEVLKVEKMSDDVVVLGSGDDDDEDGGKKSEKKILDDEKKKIEKSSDDVKVDDEVVLKSDDDDDDAKICDVIVKEEEKEKKEESGEKKEEKGMMIGEKVVVNDGNLHEYVGNPVFQSDRLYDETPIGVVMGLAWTAMGGSTLYVETGVIEQGEGKGGLLLTGQLGDVMKESASIAHTLSRKLLREIEPENEFFAKSKIHLHVPAGATPKDGPSAGCTMITSMLSLALGKRVRRDVAMTGEVTLTGRVLPIGGVKEKTVASRRSGVKVVIFPSANERDYDELLPHVKEGLEAHFVDTYQQIYDIAFQKQSAASSSSSPSDDEAALASASASASSSSSSS